MSSERYTCTQRRGNSRPRASASIAETGTKGSRLARLRYRMLLVPFPFPVLAPSCGTLQGVGHACHKEALAVLTKSVSYVFTYVRTSISLARAYHKRLEMRRRSTMCLQRSPGTAVRCAWRRTRQLNQISMYVRWKSFASSICVDPSFRTAASAVPRGFLSTTFNFPRKRLLKFWTTFQHLRPHERLWV